MKRELWATSLHWYTVTTWDQTKSQNCLKSLFTVKYAFYVYNPVTVMYMWDIFLEFDIVYLSPHHSKRFNAGVSVLRLVWTSWWAGWFWKQLLLTLVIDVSTTWAEVVCRVRSLTNHSIQRSRLLTTSTDIYHPWLSLRLSKRQLPTTVIFSELPTCRWSNHMNYFLPMFRKTP